MKAYTRVPLLCLVVVLGMTRRRQAIAFLPPISTPCWTGHTSIVSALVPRSEEESFVEEVAVPVTPCTRICRYNSNVFDGRVCIGCFRETFEIGAWGSMSAEEKYYALLDAMDRLEEAGSTCTSTSTGIAATTTTIESSSTATTTTGTSRSELLRQAEYWRALAEKQK